MPKAKYLNFLIQNFDLRISIKTYIFTQIENHIYNMHKLIDRLLEKTLLQYLTIFPSVAILGPRQCGKSTMVKYLINNQAAIYIDLQNQADLNKLTDPLLFFEANKDKIICLDEIQLIPELFSILRSVIDQNRKNGKFILLGSASRDLIQHSSESLAGRIGLLNLTPFLYNEINTLPNFNLNDFWMKGGFPDSYLAENELNSSIWKENYIKTYIERDIPQLGFQIPALQMRRLLTMCAHNQGQMLNASKLGESLGLTHPTIKRYIDLLEQTFILRTLMPYEANVKKRLVKSPKIYIRDTGILHQLLSIENYNDLLGNPIYGSSWESLVIENIIVNNPHWNAYFFRTSSGDELDLILEKGSKLIAIECKASAAPKVSKGFWNALEIIQPQKTYIIAPINDSYFIHENVVVCGLSEFLKISI